MKLALTLGRIIRRLCLAMGALFLLVSLTPLVEWLARPLAQPWTTVDRGVLIVLSGSTATFDGPPPNMMIGLNTYWRTVHAIAVWRAGHFRRILVCGLGTEETVKPILLGAGIPPDALLIENQSASTRENAVFARKILSGLEGPYVLLTSDYHVFRARRAFAREGIPVETMPAPDLSKGSSKIRNRWDAFLSLTIEYATIARYRLHGWI